MAPLQATTTVNNKSGFTLTKVCVLKKKKNFQTQKQTTAFSNVRSKTCVYKCRKKKQQVIRKRKTNYRHIVVQ